MKSRDEIFDEILGKEGGMSVILTIQAERRSGELLRKWRARMVTVVICVI